MKKLGTQSLIAGILSVVLFFTVTFYGGVASIVLNLLIAIAAITTGAIGLKETDKPTKTKSIIGLILGVLTLLIMIVLMAFNN